MLTTLPALSPFSPLSVILSDVQKSIEGHLYYPALLVALTIPEICSALSLDKTTFVKEKHYVAFIDKYTTPLDLGIAGLDCFRLRGGMVHRANLSGHAHFPTDSVIFTVPETGIALHGPIFDVSGRTAMVIDLVLFCKEMTAAVHRWYEDHHNDPKVEQNMKNLIRSCPAGLAPFVVGAPLIASGS